MTTTLGGYTGLPCEKSFEPWGVRQLATWKETRAQIPNRESQTLLVCPHLKLRTQEFCSVGGMASDALTLHFCKPIYPFTSQVSLVIKSPAYTTRRPPGAWWALGRNMGDNGWSLRVQSHSPTSKKMRLVLLFLRRKWVFSELCVSVKYRKAPWWKGADCCDSAGQLSEALSAHKCLLHGGWARRQDGISRETASLWVLVLTVWPWPVSWRKRLCLPHSFVVTRHMIHLSPAQCTSSLKVPLPVWSRFGVTFSTVSWREGSSLGGWHIH